MKDAPILCPSANATSGALLLGVVAPDLRVVLLEQPPVVGADFLEQMAGTPEAQFRFASPCMKGACGQWTGQRCGVIDQVLPLELGLPDSLPPCAIRQQCRWFLQSGKEACVVCPWVITDSRA